MPYPFYTPVCQQEGLKEDLSAFADSFGDHGYCAHREQVSISLSSVSVEKEERGIKDSGDEKEDSDDKATKDESSVSIPKR